MARLYRDPSVPPAAPEYRVARSTGPHAALLAAEAGAWAAAAAISWGPAACLTSFRALWSPSGLHLRFDAVDPSPWSTMTRRDDALWGEEVVEIFLDPDGSGAGYYELEISPANVVCDLRIERPWPALLGDRTWSLAGLETVVRHVASVDAGSALGARLPAGGPGWVATACLPWAGLAALSPSAAKRVPPQPGSRWRFNVFRIERPHGPAEPERDAVYAAWSVPDGPSFHVPAAFRDLVFG
jgi:hypothetical protein